MQDDLLGHFSEFSRVTSCAAQRTASHDIQLTRFISNSTFCLLVRPFKHDNPTLQLQSYIFPPSLNTNKECILQACKDHYSYKHLTCNGPIGEKFKSRRGLKVGIYQITKT